MFIININATQFKRDFKKYFSFNLMLQSHTAGSRTGFDAGENGRE
jgi:hypothetical protein